MSALRVATTIDLANLDVNNNPSVRTARAGVRPERITPERAADAHVLAETLTRMQVAHANLAARQVGAMVCFTGVALDNTNTPKIALPHKLNAYVVWWLVGWRGNGNNVAPVVHDDRADNVVTSDLNTLYLRSLIAGTADIMLMAVP